MNVPRLSLAQGFIEELATCCTPWHRSCSQECSASDTVQLTCLVLGGAVFCKLRRDVHLRPAGE